jgi:DNA polymerase III subunit delta
MKAPPSAVRRILAAPDPSLRAALVYGPNHALAAEAAQKLIAHALGGEKDPFALTRLLEEDIRKDKARLSDALAAQSLLGGASCVWLRIDAEAQNETILAALKEIESGAPRAFLVLEAGEIAGKGKLVGAFEAAGRAIALPFYEESEAERAAALKALIQERAMNLSPDAQDLFLAEAPVDRILARAEIEKLALFGHQLGRAISLEDVTALSIANPAPELDEAVIAAASGKRALAIERLSQSDAAAVQAIRALQRRVARLLEARLLVEGGVPVGEAGDRLKPKVFWRERDLFAAQVRVWSLAKLRAAQAALWAAEVRAKTASAVADPAASAAFAAVADLGRPDQR